MTHPSPILRGSGLNVLNIYLQDKLLTECASCCQSMTEGRRPGITGPSYFETVAASAGSAFPGSNLSCDGFKRSSHTMLSHQHSTPKMELRSGEEVRGMMGGLARRAHISLDPYSSIRALPTHPWGILIARTCSVDQSSDIHPE